MQKVLTNCLLPGFLLPLPLTAISGACFVNTIKLVLIIMLRLPKVANQYVYLQYYKCKRS